MPKFAKVAWVAWRGSLGSLGSLSTGEGYGKAIQARKVRMSGVILPGGVFADTPDWTVFTFGAFQRQNVVPSPLPQRQLVGTPNAARGVPHRAGEQPPLREKQATPSNYY